MSQEFSEDLLANTEFVEEFGFDNRAVRSYALVITGVHALQRLYPEEFAKKNLTREEFER